MNELTTIEPAEAVAAQPPDPMLAMIERIVFNPDIPLDRLERMLAMQEDQQQKQAKAEHAAAKARAMFDMPDIPKTGVSAQHGKYSTLHDITSTARPVLGRHGLYLDWDVEVGAEAVSVVAMLSHANGYQQKSSPMVLPFDKSGSKNAVQTIGSSQTYGQRYTAQSILGLSMDEGADNDGGFVKTITSEQVTQLQSALAECGVDEPEFLKMAKVENLMDLEAKRFHGAMTAISQKGRRNG